MPKTKNDIVSLALRTIGVLSSDEEASADDFAYAGDILDAEFARVKVTEGFTWAWDIETVPDALYEPLARYLASFLFSFERPLPNRRDAMAAIREHEYLDDRVDRADDDEDGTLSAEEQKVAEKSAFY